MKLLTAALIRRFDAVGSQELVDDPIVIAKLFDPAGRATWYLTEWIPNDGVFFGYCISPLGADCDEWTYVSLDELRSIRGPFGLGIERDIYWTERPLSAARGH